MSRYIKNVGQYFEYFVQNVFSLVEMSKMWVKISSIISSNFGRNVENSGQNLEHYKLEFWSQCRKFGSKSRTL